MRTQLCVANPKLIAQQFTCFPSTKVQILTRRSTQLCVANRKLIAHAGGIPAICKSMKNNLQYPGVQEYGCWALRYPFYLRYYYESTNADVQEYGCWALRYPIYLRY